MHDGTAKTHSLYSLAANGILNKSSLTIGIDFISTSTPTSDTLEGKDKANQSKGGSVICKPKLNAVLYNDWLQIDMKDLHACSFIVRIHTFLGLEETIISSTKAKAEICY